MVIKINIFGINTVEDVEKRKHSYTVGGYVNRWNNYRELYGGSLKKLKIELPYDSAIPLLGVYSEKIKTLIQKDTCIPISWQHYL